MAAKIICIPVIRPKETSSSAKVMCISIIHPQKTLPSLKKRLQYLEELFISWE